MKTVNHNTTTDRRPFASERFGALQGKRRGIATVECAVVSMLFLTVLTGTIEIGRMIMVKQILTNASREGARWAAIEGTTPAEVQQIVTDYLQNASIATDTATVTVTPTSLDTLTVGQDVSVSVLIPFNDVSWVPSPWFLDGVMLSATSVMSGERPAT